ncbi:polyprenyl synthetase family protein [Streptomyces alanosinicus]|uniref:Polyprenyl synthetase n=1 Tax=Streptomyces alanosinicus TaxID=68171 RepID=A0A918YPS9_9ACTN|nr:polyprenyl synthetase family protein [Streptomyces alanosinicus]GHE11057.1 putative polyprenyl synthetase [Streptomyces alanosinicus]
MTLAPPLTGGLDLPEARAAAETILSQFLERKRAEAAARHLSTEIPAALRDFLTAGGKRLRPVLCVLGWHAAGGTAPPPRPVLQVAAALEMFHAFCLVHDDVMDASATRRGKPTVHRAFADRHAADRYGPAADRFGTSAAILVGDFALAWTDELVHAAGLTPDQLARLLPVLDAMRDEVLYGQYLDVAAGGQPTDDVERAWTIIRFKTAKYTCERPLHIGAVLAGAPGPLLDELSAYALPLGEAFQLRDDLLGVFGDPAVTGKSRLDDLREGKHTLLIALALRDAAPPHKTLLHRLLGSPGLTEAEAAQIRSILTVTGARAHVEELIDQRRHAVLHTLDSAATLTPHAIPHLRHLADTVTRRTS